MKALAWLCRSAALSCAVLALHTLPGTTGPAGAAEEVPFITTPDRVALAMLEIANVDASDTLIDLGSGDGRIVILAAKRFGARGLGVEIVPDLVRQSVLNAQRAGVESRVEFREQDLFKADLSQATVITMYLLPALNLKLRPTILSMRPGTRVVSHSFTMEDWEPDETSSMDGRRAYFWLVPANVNGGWMLETGTEKAELSFEQRFQKIEGSVGLGHTQGGLRDARLRGFNISFAYIDNNGVRRDYTGRVTGGKMEGSFRADNNTEGRWSAAKK